jgi:hypothetical protein
MRQSKKDSDRMDNHDHRPATRLAAATHDLLNPIERSGLPKRSAKCYTRPAIRRLILMDAAVANIRASLSEALSEQGALPDAGVAALPPFNRFDPEFVLGEIDAVRRAL